MDETAYQIEEHIDRTRERLGSNLRELEDKVEAATDWREHFRERPNLFLGAAFVGGALVAATLRSGPPGRHRADDQVRHAAGSDGSARAQASALWNNVQAALIGVASARLKDYIGELVPGFDEHYRRVEKRASSIDPTVTSLGRAGG